MGYHYDKNGKFSEKGNVNYKLFNKLNSLEYYKTKGPKSLGIEFVNEKIIPLIDSFSINNNDILKTFIEHIAEQINISIIENKERFIFYGDRMFRYNGSYGRRSSNN